MNIILLLFFVLNFSPFMVVPGNNIAQASESAVIQTKQWTPGNQPANRWGDSPAVPEPGKVELPDFLSARGKKKGFVRHGIIFGPSKKFDATFNPTAWTSKDPSDGKEKVFMIIRGEENLPNAEWKRRSLPYLVSSEDGFHFTMVQENPIFQATEWYEKAGGIEDPRYFDMRLQPFVDSKDGKSFNGAILYTAYDGKTARIAVAYFNHENLSYFRKGGLLFDPADVRQNPIVATNPEWNKSPAAIQYRDPTTHKIVNLLYAGEGAKNKQGGIMAMLADTPFSWKWPLNRGPSIQTEIGIYIQNLVEPAFQPVIAPLSAELTEKTGETEGIYLSIHGDSPPRGYQLGFQIFKLGDPTGVPIFRSTSPYLFPEKAYELEGQVGKVIFASGSVVFKGQRIIYYGAGDRVIGAISAEAAK